MPAEGALGGVGARAGPGAGDDAIFVCLAFSAPEEEEEGEEEGETGEDADDDASDGAAGEPGAVALEVRTGACGDGRGRGDSAGRRGAGDGDDLDARDL